MVPKTLTVNDTLANSVRMYRPLAHNGAQRFGAAGGSHALTLTLDLDHDSALILIGIDMANIGDFEVVTCSVEPNTCAIR